MTQFARNPSSEKGTLDTSGCQLSRLPIGIRSRQDSFEFRHFRYDYLLSWRNQSLRPHSRFRH